MTADARLNEDILMGAAAIADYLGWPRRKVYHCVEARRLPVFKVGTTICARRSKTCPVD